MAAILNGILTIVRAKTFGVSANDFGYIGGGLFGGLWGATVDAQEAAKMQEYQLAKGLKQTQDYLACVMESQVSGALYQINERMDNDRVSMFNSAIQGIVSYQSDNCAAHNCLNATMVCVVGIRVVCQTQHMIINLDRSSHPSATRLLALRA